MCEESFENIERDTKIDTERINKNKIEIQLKIKDRGSFR